MTRYLCLVQTAAALTLAALPVSAGDPALPVFDAAAFSAPADNPWFPLTVGVRHVLATAETTNSGQPAVFSQRIVTGPGPVLMGVQTLQLLDETWEEGRLAERSFDYFAADNQGNIWFMGEESRNISYDVDGNPVPDATGTVWLAGSDGALPGILMPATPAAGQVMFAAHAPGGEMDYATNQGTDLVQELPGGHFAGVVKLLFQSPTEPTLRENFYFAQGVGLIRVEEDLSPAFDNPAVDMALQP